MKCIICNKEVITLSKKRKYCDNCVIIIGRKKAKQRYWANKDKINKYRKTIKYKLLRKKHDKKYDTTIKGRLRRAKSNRKRKKECKHIIESYTGEEWKNKVLSTKGICPMCKNKVGTTCLTLDHIYPVSKAEEGRIYTIKDMQPLCISCNSKKNDNILPSCLSDETIT